MVSNPYCQLSPCRICSGSNKQKVTPQLGAKVSRARLMRQIMRR
jgi:hypothetical protein